MLDSGPHCIPPQLSQYRPPVLELALEVGHCGPGGTNVSIREVVVHHEEPYYVIHDVHDELEK